MSLIEKALDFNRNFVISESYKPYETSKDPSQKLLILSCMDTRLTELLLKSINLKNGDIKLVKTAGALISSPFGSVMRSIIVGVYEFDISEIWVIGHHECGMAHIDISEMIEKFRQRGISDETLKILEYSGIAVKQWIQGFDCVDSSVRNTVELIKNHPVMPKDVIIHGLIIDPATGKLEVAVNGDPQINLELTERCL